MGSLKRRWLTPIHTTTNQKWQMGVFNLCVWVYVSVDVHPSGPSKFLLTSVILVSTLVLPALQLDSLLCHFCPLQDKIKSCPNMTTQCLPGQRCSSSRGFYGSVHVLSTQGCVDADLCGSHEVVSFRAVKYNISHTCCCKDKCNIAPKRVSSLKKLLGLIKIDNSTSDALKEDSWASCENYTLSRTTASPAIKSLV